MYQNFAAVFVNSSWLFMITGKSWSVIVTLSETIPLKKNNANGKEWENSNKIVHLSEEWVHQTDQADVEISAGHSIIIVSDL